MYLMITGYLEALVALANFASPIYVEPARVHAL